MHWSVGPEVMEVRLESNEAARYFGNWLCLHVLYNGLEPTNMCFRFARDEQKGHIRSSSYHWLRFTGDGRAS